MRTTHDCQPTHVTREDADEFQYELEWQIIELMTRVSLDSLYPHLGHQEI